MAKSLRTSDSRRIIAAPGSVVKSKIFAAGLTMGQVARAGRVSQSTLSNHLAGTRSNLLTQVKIWNAFCGLAGSKVSLADFWGELLSDRMAG